MSCWTELIVKKFTSMIAAVNYLNDLEPIQQHNSMISIYYNDVIVMIKPYKKEQEKDPDKILDYYKED